MKFLCLVFLLAGVLSSGCHRSPVPQEKQSTEKQESRQTKIDRIIKKQNAWNQKIDEARALAERSDKQLKMYRQEIQHLREHLASQTGAARKDPKAQIQKFKFFANRAKKQRNEARIMIQVFTVESKALDAEFKELVSDVEKK